LHANRPEISKVDVRLETLTELPDRLEQWR
jgi:hypothetical protein